MTDFKPAEVFAPGEYIEEERVARRWTKWDLAGKLRITVFNLNELLEGRTALTDDMARRIADVFGQNAQTWLNLESTWREFRVATLTADLKAAATDGSITCRKCGGPYVEHKPCSRWRCPKCTPECDCKEAEQCGE